jgi:membrane protein DedA with SNARE-associated domain
VLRNTVPVVAGMAHMPRRLFLTANVASAIVWAPAHVYAAQLGSLAVQQLQAGDWSSAAVAGVGLVAAAAAAVALHRRLRRYTPAPVASTRRG